MSVPRRLVRSAAASSRLLSSSASRPASGSAPNVPSGASSSCTVLKSGGYPFYGARVLGKKSSAHVFLKMALPHLVDTGRHRVLVEIEIPMDQALPRLLGDVVGRSDFAQQRDQFTRRDGKNAVLEAASCRTR